MSTIKNSCNNYLSSINCCYNGQHKTIDNNCNKNLDDYLFNNKNMSIEELLKRVMSKTYIDKDAVVKCLLDSGKTRDFVNSRMSDPTIMSNIVVVSVPANEEYYIDDDIEYDYSDVSDCESDFMDDSMTDLFDGVLYD